MKPFENLISADLASAMGETFMHALWQLAAVGVLLLFVLLFVPRKASRTRYNLGFGALCLMFALPIITFFSVYEPSVAAAAAGDATAALSGLQFGFIPTGEISGATFLEQVQGFFNDNGALVLVLWVLGALFFTLRLVGSYMEVRDLRRRNTSPAPLELQATLSLLTEKMGINRKVTLLQSARITTPMVMGTLKPVILVPIGMATGLNSDQIECLLAHELSHVRRMDYLMNVIQSMVEIVLFFHPIVWWVSKMVREERENCCDQTVIELKENRLTYAKALLNLEAIRNSRPELAMASTGGKLFRRIQRITGQETIEKMAYSRGIFIGFFTVLMVFVLSTTGSEPMKASNPMSNLMAPELQFDRDQQGRIIVANEEESASETDEASEEVEEEVELLTVANIENEFRGVNYLKGIVVSTSDPNMPFHFTSGPNAYNYQYAVQDSPIKAIVIVEDGQDVIIRLDEDGKVSSVKKDGRELGSGDYARYQDVVNESVYRYAGANSGGKMPPMPPMPDMSGMPMPPMPDMPDMSGMPMPPMPDMSKMPKMPPPPEPRGENESDAAFERRMERYEEKMEEWGEEYGERFEKQDWDGYEERMEAWAEKLASNFEEGEWEEFGERMEEWGEAFGEKWEERGEEIGERMEAWAEHFAENFEPKMDGLARSLEDLAQVEEELAHLGEEIAEQVEKELSREMRRLEDELARAEDLAEQVDGDELENGLDRLASELDRDNLVDEGDAYRIKINDEDLYINGDKQSRSTYVKYRDLVESMGIPVDGEDWVEINYKRGKSKITN